MEIALIRPSQACVQTTGLHFRCNEAENGKGAYAKLAPVWAQRCRSLGGHIPRCRAACGYCGSAGLVRGETGWLARAEAVTGDLTRTSHARLLKSQALETKHWSARVPTTVTLTPCEGAGGACFSSSLCHSSAGRPGQVTSPVSLGPHL